MSRAQQNIRIHRLPSWQDRRRQPRSDDSAVLSRINTAMADLPTYGYRRVWALLRRESERDGLPVVNAKRVYRINDTILFLSAAFASMKMLYTITPFEDISTSSLENNFIPFALRFILIVCSFAKAFMSLTDIKGKPSIPNK